MIDPDEILRLKAAVGMFHLEGDIVHAMSGRVCHIFPHNPRAQENAAFIVAACNHAPELAERVKALETENADLKNQIREAMERY